jgi:hypothetical protein
MLNGWRVVRNVLMTRVLRSREGVESFPDGSAPASNGLPVEITPSARVLNPFVTHPEKIGRRKIDKLLERIPKAFKTHYCLGVTLKSNVFRQRQKRGQRVGLLFSSQLNTELERDDRSDAKDVGPDQAAFEELTEIHIGFFPCETIVSPTRKGV